MSNLVKELEAVINRNCAENGSDTPDFILASFLGDVLKAWDRAVTAREAWYGRAPVPVPPPEPNVPCWPGTVPTEAPGLPYRDLVITCQTPAAP